MDAKQPDYPPKTPPPPKRPAQPPRPVPAPTRPVRPAVMMANRRGVNWTLDASPWTAGVVRRRVVEQLHTWGHTGADRAASAVAALLVTTAVADGAKRISVHLAPQDGQLLVVVLSPCPGLPTAAPETLPRIAELGATSCGTDTAEDGRRLWAVLDLYP
ncbi:hypothetical protein ACIOWG_10270 [Streptomyces sp. NPDC087658]|uniref:hypothetical protein n=1 Tax=Streptomyces sp. NPDC087658 TaxID=3365800 RepID=UPI00382F49DE